MSGDNYLTLGKNKQEKIKRNILDLFSYLNGKISENVIIINQLNLFEKEQEKNDIDLHTDSDKIENFIKINMHYFSISAENCAENSTQEENSPIEILDSLLCRDLYSTKTPDGEYDFFEGIMNIKYDIRAVMLNTLKETLLQKKIKYFSLMNMIIPIVKDFLHFEVGAPKKTEKKKDFEVFHKTKDSRAITNSSIELIEPISKNLAKKDFLNFLMHFYRRISKANYQDKSKTFDDNKFAFEKLYEVFSRLLECLNFFKFDFIINMDFDTEFNRIMRELITEYNDKGDLNVYTSEEDISNEAPSINRTEDNKIK